VTEVVTGPAAARRQRLGILAALCAGSALSWLLLLRQAGGLRAAFSLHAAMPMGMSGQSSIVGVSGLTAGMGPALFLAMWLAMMAAMMFPSAAPMVLLFAKVQSGRREAGRAAVPTTLFVGAYLLVWFAAGVLAYGLAVGAGTLVDHSAALLGAAPRIGAALVVLGGCYQFSPLKRRCLAKCKAPMDFILGGWRDGKGGAVRMGAVHGAYCLGCCWMLFLLLLPLGMMNITAMGVLTVLVFAEKVLPSGRRIAAAGGAALVAFGLAAIAVPHLLPTQVPVFG
jgi:predicted metal-binding membrane protein